MTEVPDEDRDLSFEQLHEKYFDKIYAVIFRLVGNEADANNLTQNTFINAYRAWGRFSGETPVYAWLYQIAVNNCKNLYRVRDAR